jgi:hypothetical protein
MTANEQLERKMENKIKTFYRMSKIDCNSSFWYDFNGNFTNIIQSDALSFLNAKNIPMPYNADVLGYLSGCDTLVNLYNWFTHEEMLRLQKMEYALYKYQSSDYRHVGTHFIFNKENYLTKNIIVL